MITSRQIQTCVEVARKYGAKKLVLFGSANEEPEKAQDIDLICDGVRGLDLLRMAAEIENETGAPVDVVSAVPRTPFVSMNAPRGRVIHAVA